MKAYLRGGDLNPRELLAEQLNQLVLQLVVEQLPALRVRVKQCVEHRLRQDVEVLLKEVVLLVLVVNPYKKINEILGDTLLQHPLHVVQLSRPLQEELADRHPKQVRDHHLVLGYLKESVPFFKPVLLVVLLRSQEGQGLHYVQNHTRIVHLVR